MALRLPNRPAIRGRTGSITGGEATVSVDATTATPVMSKGGATTASALPAVQGRLAALDVLRGIAILGTLAMNIGIFLAAAPEVAPVTPFDGAVSTALGLVTDGKFIGLLTIMFGIGLEIQRQAALRKGETWLGSYPWRAALLVLDGLLNYIFIFEFDVLMGYGLTALVVCVVLTKSPRVQKWVLGVGVGAHLALMTFMSLPGTAPDESAYAVVDQVAANPSAATPEQLAQAAELLDTTPDQVAAVLAAQGVTPGGVGPVPGSALAGTQSYWGGVQERLTNFWDGRSEIPIMFVMGMGLFLVGAFLYRGGLFAEHGARLRRRVMLVGFGIGLPLDWGTRLFVGEYTSMLNRYVTSALVAFGVLALVAAFYAKGRRPGRVGRAVSNVGKMALTCYIGQNLIASILFYNWGLGLAQYLRWGVWNTIIAWAGVSAILLIFSALWLRRFSRGPVEWLWHLSHAWIMKRTMPYVERVNARKAARRDRTVQAVPGPAGQ